MVFLGHGNGGVHILDNHGPRQEVLHDAAVLVITAHQFRGDAHKAPEVLQSRLLEAPALDTAHGQEGGPAGACAFQVGNGGLAVLFGRYHYLLHGGTQGNFDCHGVGIVGADKPGYRAVDVP